MPFKLILTVLSVIGFQSLSTAQEAEVVSIPPISVTYPRGDDWNIVKRDSKTIVFQRVGQIAKKQATAYATVLMLVSSGDPKEIEAELRNAVATSLPKQISVQSVNYVTSEDRGYPCVTASAETSISLNDPQTLRVISLPTSMLIMACRLAGISQPRIPNGFMAAYSSTSMQKFEAKTSHASDFIGGVKWRINTPSN